MFLTGMLHVDRLLLVAIILAGAFIFPGCALRMGYKPDNGIITSRYPPIKDKSASVLCLPCLEFDGGYSVGLMFVYLWPVLFVNDDF